MRTPCVAQETLLSALWWPKWGRNLKKEWVYVYVQPRGFPDSSVGKESACNAGDLGLIPGLGRSSGEGIGYPLQYSWASLVAQLVKNPPGMRETWLRSLGRSPGEGKGYPLQYSGLENSTIQSMGSQRVGHDWATFTFIHVRVVTVFWVLFIFIHFFFLLVLSVTEGRVLISCKCWFFYSPLILAVFAPCILELRC